MHIYIYIYIYTYEYLHIYKNAEKDMLLKRQQMQVQTLEARVEDMFGKHRVGIDLMQK